MCPLGTGVHIVYPKLSGFGIDQPDIDWPDAACLEVQNQQLPCWLDHEDHGRTSQRKFHCQRWFPFITYIKILGMSLLKHLKTCLLNAIAEAFCANGDIETRHDTIHWYAETQQNTVQDKKYIRGVVLSYFLADTNRSLLGSLELSTDIFLVYSSGAAAEWRIYASLTHWPHGDFNEISHK